MTNLRLLNPHEDAEALYALFGDKESCKYLSQVHNKTVSETKAILINWTRGSEETSWAITNGHDQTCLGTISIFPKEDDVWEAAIGIVPRFRDSGLGTKAMNEAINIIFEQYGARRIYADCDPENISSIALFERLGFLREGYLRQTWKTHIGIRDTVLLALLASDPRPYPNRLENT